MSKNQIPLYATPEDWRHLIATVSSQRSLKLVKMGLFTAPVAQACNRVEDLEPLSSYLVLDEASKVCMRAVPQREGDVKHAVDQLGNTDSVVLHLGGMEGENRLLAGQMGTAQIEKISQDLYALFTQEIKKTFVKVKSYYVGPQALQLLDKGARLSPTSRALPTYDLVR